MQKPEQIHEKFAKAFNAGDLEALVALYEPGTVLAASTGQLVKGHNAIREAYRGFLAMKPSMTVETLNAFESGDAIALLHGRWSMKATGPDGGEIRRAGRNTEVVRRQRDGSWLFLIDNPFTPE